MLGNRYIAVTGGMWVKDTAKILYEEFKPQGIINYYYKNVINDAYHMH